MDNNEQTKKDEKVEEIKEHDDCKCCKDGECKDGHCKDGECKEGECCGTCNDCDDCEECEDCEDCEECIDVEKELNDLSTKLEAEKEARLSVMADYMNFRKRTDKEKEELHIEANKHMLEQVMEILEDFDRAVHMEADKIDVENDFYKGVMIIHKKMTDLLNSYGLSEIEVQEGADLDPMTMQAIATAPTVDKDKVNKVIHVAGKGFINKATGKVFRTAKVIIGKA
jgi:molecular chaperone GrpE